MIEALAEFWNPSYCCFTLDGVDLAPTIEEYTSLLHLAKLPTPFRTYAPARTSIIKDLFRVTEVKVQNLRDSKVTWEHLKELMKKEGKEEVQLHLLALAIYGLLIFPKELGIIDHATIAFVAQVKEGVNPVYGILAETFRSLNRCRIRRHARLTCCVPLLYVWMMNHLPSIQVFFRTSFSTIRIPLAEFEVARWEEHAGRIEWKDRLQNLVSKGIVWQAPWIDQPKVIYGCGNLPWVPLLGPWGGISYAPLMFRRQVGAIQFVLMTHGLTDARFTYEDDDSQRKIREFFVSWRHVYIVKATSQNRGVQESYELWKCDRVDPRFLCEGKTLTNDKRPRETMCPSKRMISREQFPKRGPVDPQLEPSKQPKIQGLSSKKASAVLRKEKQRLQKMLDQKVQ
ncbi:uncharacterized protein LOC131158637 [Malania oleifera]|uniref:uncharacterized protein LOC131158637 n=1 Tax=Malania oleifera TaxID=397392 RepID=UPI0025ADCA7C|nr:uncharacterized protein LOC131158637 [Malania oleifera]